jgi:hypothetical protein
MSLPWTWTILIRGQLEGVFVLAFVVEFEVGYNSLMHKTQPQKLFFIAFFSFFDESHTQNSTSTSKTNTL